MDALKLTLLEFAKTDYTLVVPKIIKIHYAPLNQMFWNEW